VRREGLTEASDLQAALKAGAGRLSHAQAPLDVTPHKPSS
jgi:hypothetical protein